MVGKRQALLVFFLSALFPRLSAAQELHIAQTSDLPSVYEHAQAKVSVTVYYMVPPFSGSAGQPRVRGMEVFPLPEFRSDRVASHQGGMFFAQTFPYLIFPPKAGTVTVPPVSFRGQAVGPIVGGEPNYNAPNPYQYVSFAETRRVEVESEPLSIEVRPVPKGLFPAAGVLMSQALEPPPEGGYTTAQMLKRVVTVDAFGVHPDALIPPAGGSSPPSLSMFSGEPAVSFNIKDPFSHAQAVYTYLYRVGNPGTVALPPLSLRWLNTATEEVKETALPAIENIAVAAGAGPAAAPGKGPALPLPLAAPGLWAAVFAVLTVGALVFWIYRRFFSKHWREMRKQQKEERAKFQAVMAACDMNSPWRAGKALLAYARLRALYSGQASITGAEPMTLADVGALFDHPAFKEELAGLSRALYQAEGSAASPWRGSKLKPAFISAVRAARARGKKMKKDKTLLPPLYPHGGSRSLGVFLTGISLVLS